MTGVARMCMKWAVGAEELHIDPIPFAYLLPCGVPRKLILADSFIKSSGYPIIETPLLELLPPCWAQIPSNQHYIFVAHRAMTFKNNLPSFWKFELKLVTYGNIPYYTQIIRVVCTWHQKIIIVEYCVMYCITHNSVLNSLGACCRRAFSRVFTSR